MNTKSLPLKTRTISTTFPASSCIAPRQEGDPIDLGDGKEHGGGEPEESLHYVPRINMDQWIDSGLSHDIPIDR